MMLLYACCAKCQLSVVCAFCVVGDGEGHFLFFVSAALLFFCILKSVDYNYCCPEGKVISIHSNEYFKL